MAERIYFSFMFRVIIILIAFVLFGKTGLSVENYILYHKKIVLAEEEIFLKDKVHKGLLIYADVFEKFDFVFLQDCIIAMQLSLYIKDEVLFLKFADKAIKNGLLLRHFALLKYIATHPIYIKNEYKIKKHFQQNRSTYLKRIDTATLKKVISLYSYDQMDKIKIANETDKQYYSRYKPFIQETTYKLMKLIHDKGFLGDRLIGIDQNDILKELHLGNYDAIDYYIKHKNDPGFHAVQLQFGFDEHYFSSTIYFPIIIHFVNSWKQHSDRCRYIVHTDSFYREQIAKGNMHPQELANLYDLGFNFVTTPKPDTTKGEKYFGIQLVFSTKDRPDSILDAGMNHFRTTYNISTIQCQRAKVDFLRKHRMHYSFGYLGCRS